MLEDLELILEALKNGDQADAYAMLEEVIQELKIKKLLDETNTEI
jgi:DNA-binding GntR family transcriptional regulator|tara:strand:+ start:1575 stop:1709 length:135 start_codon:yes stop_codon:yes gene_type:complete